ncbi:NmrA/HSCARG family protein [Nesterenkonia halobia]
MSTSTQRTIAVFGATGTQGGAVVDALLARDVRVRALVRSPESDRSRALADRGVELARSDVDAPGTLVEALSGVDGLFFMTTPPGGVQTGDVEGETRQGIALGDAAAAAEVPQVVFSSVGGAERRSGVPHFESKRRVEEHLQGTGRPVTIIRPAFFMENFLGMRPTVEGGELVVRLPLPDDVPLQMVAVRDIGVVAARALLETDAVPAEMEIAGDERTGGEMAAAFAAHTGLPGRYEPLPLQVLDGSDDLQAMFRWFAETPAYRADIDQVRSIVGDLRDLPAWLQDADFRTEG